MTIQPFNPIYIWFKSVSDTVMIQNIMTEWHHGALNQQKSHTLLYKYITCRVFVIKCMTILLLMFYLSIPKYWFGHIGRSIADVNVGQLFKFQAPRYWSTRRTPLQVLWLGLEVVTVCPAKHTYLARGTLWSLRQFPQGEAFPLHYGWADPCDHPKCGWLECVIFVSGGLRSRFPLNWK